MLFSTNHTLGTTGNSTVALPSLELADQGLWKKVGGALNAISKPRDLAANCSAAPVEILRCSLIADGGFTFPLSGRELTFADQCFGRCPNLSRNNLLAAPLQHLWDTLQASGHRFQVVPYRRGDDGNLGGISFQVTHL